MKLSISKTGRSKGGRPRTNATPVLVRLQPPDLAALDAYVDADPDPMTRPQAIRAILSEWLRTHGFGASNLPKPRGPATDVVAAMDAAIKEHRGSKAQKKR